MGKQVSYDEIAIVAGSGTITIPVRDMYEVYNVTSGTVTLSANCNITTSGTPVEGTIIWFRYTADITKDIYDLQFFGIEVPDRYSDKNMLVQAYYDGAKWQVLYFVDIDEDGIISKAQLVDSPYPVIDDDTGSASAVTINTSGDQLLRSFTVAANSIQNAGEYIKIQLFGTSAANVNDKLIKVKIVSGGSVDIYENSTITAIQGDWKLDLIVPFTDINNGYWRSVGVLDNGQGTDVESNSTTIAPTIDPTASMTIEVYAEEVVPTGGEVTLHGGEITIHKQY